jgi:hypothetical protein
MILCSSAGATPADALTSDTTETKRLDLEALEHMAARLEATESYRILRRLEPCAGATTPPMARVVSQFEISALCFL